MGNAYSLDLRERVVRAYQFTKGATYLSVGERFEVSSRTVSRWVKLYRDTGSLEPLPDSGGTSTRKIFEEHERAIRQWYQDQPDLTQQELADRLLEVYDIQIGQPSICKLLKRMGLTRKKKVSEMTEPNAPMCEERGWRG